MIFLVPARMAQAFRLSLCLRFSRVGFIFFSLLPIGCASAFKGSIQGTVKGAVRLELKNPTRVSYGAYRSLSRTQEYSTEGDQSQIVRDRNESVDFIIRTEPVVNPLVMSRPVPVSDPVVLVLTTTDKSGSQNLNDYGFPELKESIEFHYTPGGQVLKAGEYSETSLFFIPPLPLPSEPVEVGDTWELKHQWISSSGGLLELTAIGIFKGLQGCGSEAGPQGESDTCADIEISGSVSPVGLDNELVQVHSKLTGRILFAINRGEVVSSQMSSQEQVILPQMKLHSQSCMVSSEASGPSLKSAKLKSCSL